MTYSNGTQRNGKKTLFAICGTYDAYDSALSLHCKASPEVTGESISK